MFPEIAYFLTFQGPYFLPVRTGAKPRRLCCDPLEVRPRSVAQQGAPMVHSLCISVGKWKSRRLNHLKQQHAIPIGVKPVSLLDRMAIGGQHSLSSHALLSGTVRESRNKHK